MIDKQYVESFFAETTAVFHFLEKQYDYKKLEVHINILNNMRDAMAGKTLLNGGGT